MKIKYKIEFYSDWHCGSGLSAGADLDALVIKDKNNLPFIPGKTLKGLIREATEEVVNYKGEDKKNDVFKLFGETDKGLSFFSNAELSLEEREYIVANKLQKYLYRGVSSTAIDDTGIAIDHSLRRMEVCVPLILYAEIIDVPNDSFQILEDGLSFIKRLGQNRNRGLGRCKFTIIEKEEK